MKTLIDATKCSFDKAVPLAVVLWGGGLVKLIKPVFFRYKKPWGWQTFRVSLIHYYFSSGLLREKKTIECTH